VKTERGGVVFFGPSGSGKTTLAERLKKEGVEIISDEAVAVRPTGEGSYVVEGLPWRGRRLSAPLLGLFHLSPGPGLAFHSLGPREFFRALCPSVYFIDDSGRQFGRFLEICEPLIVRVPCYRMECSRTAPFWPEALDLITAESIC
jgi:GTPase SAR1 family protein